MPLSTMAHPFVDADPPAWASGYGQDEYGYFAEFSVSTGPQYWEFVTQRMRWIPPGTFRMGSPDDEPERWDNEGPQHEVTLTRGFWLADTACTQELWESVMGKNLSYFKGEQRPVEQVSYHDVELFLARLTELVPGLIPELPTESQWEYACRAGTTTPFSFGTTITTDQVNFDGNFPYAGSPKGTYRQTTVDVKSLPANRWGLYQMHGNVWEWCSDWYAAYSSHPQTDPTGPEQGSLRVIRGGSWGGHARYARSARRGRYVPGGRFGNLGFRLLSSASPAQPEPPNY